MGKQDIGNVSDSVVLQFRGNNNSISICHGSEKLLDLELPIRRKQALRPHPDPVMCKVNTYAEATKFVGRKPLLDGLLAWLDSPPKLSIRTFAGPAGIGKTRLALELMTRSKANTLDGGSRLSPGTWAAGFLARPQPTPVSDIQGLRFVNPVLAIVDYAASLRAFLRSWLEYLAVNLSEQSCPVRVLLLERDASTEAGWLHDLIKPERFSRVGLAGHFSPLEPTPLQPLENVADRKAIFLQMQEQFAQIDGIDYSGLPSDKEAVLDHALQEAQWGNPLHTIMAAAACLRRGLSEVLSMSRTDLAECLARDHELGRMKLQHDSLLSAYLAACSTISGGFSQPEARDWSEKLLKITQTDYPGNGPSLARDTTELLPNEKSNLGVGQVKPDIIGEAFVYHALTADPYLLPTDVLGDMLYEICQVVPEDRTAGQGKEDPIAYLIRLWRDFGGVPEQMRGHKLPAAVGSLKWFDALLAKAAQVKDLGFLRRLSSAIPLGSLTLAEPGLRLERMLCEAHRKLASSQPEAFLPGLAASLNNLGARLSETGRRDEALEATREAVEIRRKLASSQPEAFLPDLAASLNNLGNRLSETGRRDEALEATREAVETYRKLASSQPEAFLPDLARALGTLHIVQKAGGDLTAAEKSLIEAISALSPVFVQQPQPLGRLMASLVRHYIAVVQELGREPDEDLLEPLLPALSGLFKKDAADG